MRLTIDSFDPTCPAGTPVSLVDLDTGERVACHASVVDAVAHKALLERGELAFADDDPDDDDDGQDDDYDPDDPDDDDFIERAFRAGYASAVTDCNALIAYANANAAVAL